MNQYCRYCNALTTGNGIWCETKQKNLSESYTKRVNKCKDFEFNEIDAYSLDRKYTPREPEDQQIEGQMSIEDFLVPAEPLCYTCVNARRRGKFRECAVGGKGYKKLNEITASCGEYIKVEEE